MKVLFAFIYMMSFTQSSNILFNFQKNSNLSNWRLTNDTVMGGVSSSSIFLNEAGNGVFSGIVSTANNGGFAMARLPLSTTIPKTAKHILIRVKGDHKNYQFRIKANKNQRYWYVQSFTTTDDWEVIKLPLTDFYASFRGYQLDLKNFASNKIQEIAILIGNKKDEEFNLEIDFIEVK